MCRAEFETSEADVDCEFGFDHRATHNRLFPSAAM